MQPPNLKETMAIHLPLPLPYINRTQLVGEAKPSPNLLASQPFASLSTLFLGRLSYIPQFNHRGRPKKKRERKSKITHYTMTRFVIISVVVVAAFAAAAVVEARVGPIDVAPTNLITNPLGAIIDNGRKITGAVVDECAWTCDHVAVSDDTTVHGSSRKGKLF